MSTIVPESINYCSMMLGFWPFPMILRNETLQSSVFHMSPPAERKQDLPSRSEATCKTYSERNRIKIPMTASPVGDMEMQRHKANCKKDVEMMPFSSPSANHMELWWALESWWENTAHHRWKSVLQDPNHICVFTTTEAKVSQEIRLRRG